MGLPPEGPNASSAICESGPALGREPQRRARARFVFTPIIKVGLLI